MPLTYLRRREWNSYALQCASLCCRALNSHYSNYLDNGGRKLRRKFRRHRDFAKIGKFMNRSIVRPSTSPPLIHGRMISLFLALYLFLITHLFSPIKFVWKIKKHKVAKSICAISERVSRAQNGINKQTPRQNSWRHGCFQLYHPLSTALLSTYSRFLIPLVCFAFPLRMLNGI